jgi:hypothetical protein
LSIGWFILNIQSDLFWHRCLERQTFGTPQMYTLSLLKSIKRSNCGEFLKVVKLNRDIHVHFTCILCLLNNTCVKHNFKSVHVSNLFWGREYNSAKEICKYASFSKVGGNYPLDLKIIWSSVEMQQCIIKMSYMGIPNIIKGQSVRNWTDISKKWINNKTDTISMWTVFGQSTYTNNDVEGCHHRFNKKNADQTAPF